MRRFKVHAKWSGSEPAAASVSRGRNRYGTGAAAVAVRALPPGVRSSVLFSLMVLAWSGNYLFVRVGLASASPLWLATLRAAAGSAGVGLYLLLSQPTSTLRSRDRRDALLLGLPNTAAFLGLWFVAAGSVAAGEAAVVIYTFPLWVALFSVPALGRHLGRAHWVAVAAGFAGVVLVSEPWSTSLKGVPILPFGELLGAAVCWAGATVVFQRRFQPEQLASANGLQLFGGSLALAAMAIVWDHGQLPHPTASLGLSVLWLGLFGTAFAYVVWFWLLGRQAASTLSAYTFLVPLGALGLAVIFQGESVGLGQAVGVVLVLLGVYAVARASRP